MASYDLETGIDLLDKVTMKINERGKYEEIKDVTFLFFDCQNYEDLDLIKTHPLTKNIILIGDLKSEEKNITNISTMNWQKNKEEYYKETKNSFIIHGKPELALEETYSMLTEYSKIYPLVLFYSSNEVNKKDISKETKKKNEKDEKKPGL